MKTTNKNQIDRIVIAITGAIGLIGIITMIPLIFSLIDSWANQNNSDTLIQGTTNILNDSEFTLENGSLMRNGIFRDDKIQTNIRFNAPNDSIMTIYENGTIWIKANQTKEIAQLLLEIQTYYIQDKTAWCKGFNYERTQ